MRPESNSRRLFGITRSKGKMYEFGLPEKLHIAIPENSNPHELFGLTVATLGDAAARVSDMGSLSPTEAITEDITRDLDFAASFFDAFLAARFSEEISRDVIYLASSAYYLANRPGSSLVLARGLSDLLDEPIVDETLRTVLQANWSQYSPEHHPIFGDSLGRLVHLLGLHFEIGEYSHAITRTLEEIREKAYRAASARDLLFTDIISAVVRMRLNSSAWKTLPQFSGIDAGSWMNVIQRSEFPKELWPSQKLIGEAGLFRGESGVIQMPTSAGKTRSIEIVLRSAFLSERTKLAVIVAPFRSLCHEIGMTLRHAFRTDAVKVNELSDALQLDFVEEIAEFLGIESPSSKFVLVLTPEKLLYVLRQTPSITKHIGTVIYDEGHQFDSGSRGVTYELLLTEIKALLPENAQTILVSAVIQNAEAVGAWLIGEQARIVNGTTLLPTARSVAFASWVDTLGQMLFYESGAFNHYDYFVPRVIEQQQLHRLSSDKKERFFPEKGESKDVSLYLGLRLAPKGAVAIFCGRKDTASGIATRAAEIYKRGYGLPPPSTISDENEVRRLKNLIDMHFGESSDLSHAALQGVFVHHANTPHGLRLAIEYAMQRGLIKLVVCTSTLAQGVNLPIRYLIVSSIYQGGDLIKTRDFQNLMGRAGRAGMHTEGLVIFADPHVYDERFSARWRFNASVELLSPEKAESTTSSIRRIITPFADHNGREQLSIAADALCQLLLADESTWVQWTNEVVRINPTFQFDAKELLKDLKNRRRLLVSIESFLMANRGVDAFNDFKSRVENLAKSTLAYHLASDETKPSILAIFSSLAEHIENSEPNPVRQAVYAKTLLSARSAKQIESWVDENREFLLSLESTDEWLRTVWKLLASQLDDKFFHAVEPTSLAIELAGRWLLGEAYASLYAHAHKSKGTKPWGENKRRRLTEDDIIDFCESTLSFDCSLVLAAVAQFLFNAEGQQSDEAAVLNLFQKSIKYGLPDRLSISAYELGFADRVLAQHLRDVVQQAGYTGTSFALAIANYWDDISIALTDYPSYFESVLMGLSEH